MIIARSITSVRRRVRAWRRDGRTVSLVPTMGALHAGHLSLIDRAVRRSDRTVVSIFVNPTQFGPKDAPAAYPRSWRADLAACRKAGVDLIFAPSVETMYPQGSEGSETTVRVGSLAARWEGAERPGHLDGVATVVLKLFIIVQPDVAIFGRKDYQQSVVIRRMAADFDLPVRIIVVPTVREGDGLALSSRNVYLGTAARSDATSIYRALKWAGREVRAGALTAGPLVRRMKTSIEGTGSFRVDYIGFCDPETLQPRRKLSRPLVILIAATCVAGGRARGRRYIDNLLIR